MNLLLIDHVFEARLCGYSETSTDSVFRALPNGLYYWSGLGPHVMAHDAFILEVIFLFFICFCFFMVLPSRLS